MEAVYRNDQISRGCSLDSPPILNYTKIINIGVIGHWYGILSFACPIKWIVLNEFGHLTPWQSILHLHSDSIELLDGNDVAEGNVVLKVSVLAISIPVAWHPSVQLQRSHFHLGVHFIFWCFFLKTWKILLEYTKIRLKSPQFNVRKMRYCDGSCSFYLGDSWVLRWYSEIDACTAVKDPSWIVVYSRSSDRTTELENPAIVSNTGIAVPRTRWE